MEGAEPPPCPSPSPSPYKPHPTFFKLQNPKTPLPNLQFPVPLSPILHCLQTEPAYLFVISPPAISRSVQLRPDQGHRARAVTVLSQVDEDHIQTLRKGKGKRDSGSGIEVRVDAAWRDPKRQRDSESAVAFSSSKYLKLQSSLKLLCSFDDLTQRMRLYMSLGSCKGANKCSWGFHRPVCYEVLGNVILKRFLLLLVLILDRAKSQSSLSLKYGIEGVDGGSPLFFTVHSGIKSSHHDFLSSDIMLGEGNISAHLVILGYKDLINSVRSAIQLLQDDSSILMKMAVPSDTHKSHLANCGTALQYLRQAGVVLHDDGMMIMEDDIADGDKELTISLLWNTFVHLQLPLLVKKTTLADEICKIRGNMDSFINVDSPPLNML
ncbi:hypothetical protein M0R45_015734 [Rubus argutus]|uniref:Calponin-homology (CH) domain-containing protein n=1 Tax=Rubus argutus TaxID=59490 RepID=A0AAW1XSG5_RUBAR